MRENQSKLLKEEENYRSKYSKVTSEALSNKIQQ
jgi:hypothetical protein